MEYKLPTLAELHVNNDVAFRADQLNMLLNQPPHASWIKTHPVFKHQYLPIDKVEFLLTRIFQQWRVEVLNVVQLFNSIAVTVRLHYINPITGQWSFHDGVGASALQLDAGAQPSDISKIKGPAVMMALPIAKTQAIKDATDHLGSLFGRDLSRKDTVQFEGFFVKNEKHAPAEKKIEPINNDTLEF